jgi:6-phosphogluconolactonase
MKPILCLTLFSMSLSAIDRNLYVGTYTRGDSSSKGIYLLKMDTSTGALSAPILAAEAGNPSFLAVHKNGRNLYAVNEGSGGSEVLAFSINSDGTLKLLNKQEAKGNGPCHLNIDKTGKFLAVANYGSGSAATFPIGADGSLGGASAMVQHVGKSVNANRQSGPHAHSVNFSRDNKWLYIADLGLDQVKIYSFNAKTGAIQEKAVLETPKGAGPRHLALSKNGLVYVLNEMASSISVFRYTGQATTQPLSTVSALPAGFQGNTSGAETLLHKSGKLLFSSNRGHDTISIFATDPATGNTTLAGHQSINGKTPRNFVLSPDNKFLLAAGQDSDTIQVFRIAAKDRKLDPVGSPAKVGKPVCLRFAAK